MMIRPPAPPGQGRTVALTAARMKVAAAESLSNPP